MCRLVSDQTQPMNSKVKVAWLEYFLELLPLVEGSDFKDTTGEYTLGLMVWEGL